MSKAALIGGLAGRLAKAPVVLNTAHNFGWLALSNPLLKRLFWFYDKMIFGLTLDRLVTISRLQEQDIVKAKLVPRDRVVTILNGIDVGKLLDKGRTGVTRSDLGLPEEAVVVITVARLVWFKAVDQLIEAAALLDRPADKVRFVIVGDGDKRTMLESRIRERGLEGRVHLLGPRLDVPRLLALSDIFALPSVSEGMPISILEAMAYELPVVATNVDGNPELIVEGETGHMVPARSPARLAEALAPLLDDGERRAALGRRGRKRVECHFTDRVMAERTDELYRRLLEEKWRKQ